MTNSLSSVPSKVVSELANDITFRRIITSAIALGFAGALGSVACLEHTSGRMTLRHEDAQFIG